MKYYVIDVFTDEMFKGNAAGVCLLEKWLDDDILQKIASENNLSETAYLVKKDGYYDLRWFTPTVEVDLCGHATLASAFVIMNFVDTDINKLNFKTKSGILTVEKAKDLYVLDFPSRKPQQTRITEQMRRAICASIAESYTSNNSRDLLLVLIDERQVQYATPNFELLKQIAGHMVMITARGDNCDFVSRVFVPNVGINEDPVTGSAHCTLIPYWSEKLGKTEMTAKQISKRSGVLYCEDAGERVKIGGKAVCYLAGEIKI